MERNHRMELQYDGTGLHGWAKQDGLQTVEGCLEEAFRTVLGQAPPALRVAGRTDAGVHARRQVVSLLLPEGIDLLKLRRSLNALTPPGIAMLELRPAPAAFDARKNAISRTYRYFVCDRPGGVAVLGRLLLARVRGADLDAIREAAGLVVGRHRFTAFTPTESEHVFFDRTVRRCRWSRMSGASPIGPGSGPGLAPWKSQETGARQPRHVLPGDRGGRLPAPHGARPRGDDDRGGAGRAVAGGLPAPARRRVA